MLPLHKSPAGPPSACVGQLRVGGMPDTRGGNRGSPSSGGPAPLFGRQGSLACTATTPAPLTMQHAGLDVQPLKEALQCARPQQRLRQLVEPCIAGQLELVAQAVLPKECHPVILPGVGLGGAAYCVAAHEAKLGGVVVLRLRKVHVCQLAPQLGCIIIRGQRASGRKKGGWVVGGWPAGWLVLAAGRGGNRVTATASQPEAASLRQL